MSSPPSIGRRVLNHWATREVPLTTFEFLSGVIDTGQAAKEGMRRKDDSAGLIQARKVVIINYQVDGEEGETGWPFEFSEQARNVSFLASHKHEA